MTSSAPTRFIAGGLLWLALLATAPAQDAANGYVSGKVTFENGIPLGKGRILFHPERGEPITARLLADGTFEAKAVPIGKLAVTFDAPGLPKAYGDPKATPLAVEVKAGKNNLDFKLRRK